MPYDPGEVVEVIRGPRDNAAAGTYRAFAATLKGLKMTFGRMVEGPTTISYPEEKTPVYPRFRGRHKLHRFEDTGLEKCVGCSLCAAACPADCIRVVAAENTPENRVSAGERYAAVYEINLSRCIFCGYCEIACPFDAITMGHDYEMADYNRSDLIFTKEMLLAEPLERTPLRSRGRVAWRADMAEVFFFLAAIGAVAGAAGTVILRDAFYSVLALVCHLIFLAMLFLLLRAEFVAAAQVIVYAGAVMVLYVFVVGYVGGMEAGLAGPTGRGLRIVSVLFAFALFVELAIALIGSGVKALDTEGAPYKPGFGEPAEIGKQFLTNYLVAFEVASLLLLIAAVGAVILARRRSGLADAREISVAEFMRRQDRGRRATELHATMLGSGGPRAAMSITWYLVVSALIFCIGAGGVLTRRNPLVILLCLELMLNAANLALVAFARAHGDMGGQIFALMVMVVAACEVAVGLGLVVAIYRRRLPIDVDELRELQG